MADKEHEHGSMNTEDHEKMYGRFMTFVTRSVYVIVAFLVLLAIFAR